MHTATMATVHSTIFAALMIAPLLIYGQTVSSSTTVQSTTAEGTESPLSPRSYSFYDGSFRDTPRNPYYSSAERHNNDDTVTGRPFTVASTSYSVKSSSNNGGNSGAAVYVDTAPLPITFTRYPHPTATTDRSASYESIWRNHDRSRPVNNIRDKILAAECEGADCEEDLNRSYYSVLNGNHAYPGNNNRFPTRSETELNRRYSSGNAEEEDGIYTRYASFPFNVRSNGPEQYDFPKRRVTRTSTTTPSSSPGWVQLSPRPSHNKDSYDPFSAKGDDQEEGKEEEKPTNKLEKRLGVELNPDSFAARWGWGEKAGSRLPDWLVKLNEQYATLSDISIRRPGGPTRDEDPKNWVKLEPIPVSGVSISKWVPKGTPAQELPTTGNNVRGKPSAWWDAPLNSLNKRPSSYGTKNTMGWASSNNDYDLLSSLYTKRPNKPGNAWQDVIYPDTPGSATASWESTTDILKGTQQRFPSGGGGWKAGGGSGGLRNPVATWSAPGSNRNYIRKPNNNYPDLQSGDDDPRWVLISNTRHSTPSKNSLSHHYRPNPDRWRLELPDRLDVIDHDYEPHEGPMMNTNGHRRRVGKDYKMAEQSPQDEAFQRVNFTLHNLKPVLNFDRTDEGRGFKLGYNGTTTTVRATSTTTTTTTTKRPKVEQSAVKDVIVSPPRRTSLLSALMGGSGRQSTLQSTTTAGTAEGTKQVVVRKGNSMKPVLAAVGAGMIPAAMAAAIPMMMGRRRRSVFGTDQASSVRHHHTPRGLVKSAYYNRPVFSLDRRTRALS